MNTDGAPAAPQTLPQLPLFPLGTVLFPGGWMPLRIFEVRYLDMVNRCLETGAPFGVVCLTEGSEVRRIDPRSPTGFAREAFHTVGTLARIEQVERPQAGLMLIRCRGQQRFHVERSWQLPHGLWMGDVRLDPPEPTVPVPDPDDLMATRDALQRLLDNLRARTGVVARPAAATALRLGRQRLGGQPLGRTTAAACRPQAAALMALDNPLLRLELISDLLDRMGVKR